MASAPTDVIVRDVLPAYGLHGAVARPFGAGLINQTFLVEGAGEPRVLQRVSPIFPPGVQDNIEAVTARLAQVGLATPRLIPTRAGQLCLQLGEGGVWRLMTYVVGASFDVVASPGQARGAAALVARFHAALDALAGRPFAAMRVGVHDTARHLATLAAAASDLPAHRLHAAVAPLADEVREAAAAMPRLPALPDRVCHGDLKINNVIFAGCDGAAREQAVCLIDLDTVGPMSLAFELGDAWRSWCNRAGEDTTEAALDLAIFAASLDGYREGLGRALTGEERAALLHGPEWVSLELTARFAADALRESYFGWDPARFAGRGEHNLIRARGQWSLFQAFLTSRAERARLLETS